MPSQIKVDEIKNVAGQYEIKTDTFKGQTTAGSINVQGEGTATTNLQQGLAKSWANLNGTGTIALRDSFNVSSVADDGTGDYDFTYTNNFENVNYSIESHNCFTSTGAWAVFNSAEEVPATNFHNYKIVNRNGGAQDEAYNFYSTHGDLA